MRVIINTPDISLLGGVANHYKGLKNYWNEDVHYNYIGRRDKIPGSIVFIFDIIKFIYKCIFIRPDIVVLNPSLRKYSLIRDSIYLKVSKFFKIRTIIFFHGWDSEKDSSITRRPESFVSVFNNADCILVLAIEFKKKLIQWGIKQPIYLTTTKVDESLLFDFDIEQKIYGETLLFLARIEEEKGILIALKAFQCIKKDRPYAKFIVAGSGSYLNVAKRFVHKNNITNVEFTGFISGQDLINVYESSDIYLLPTYGEGMPTSVLEAMAFGLPIISRPVGGLVDFFEDDRMGYLIENLDPQEYCKKINSLLENKISMKSIGLYNHQYSASNFLASKVAHRMERMFYKVLYNG